MISAQPAGGVSTPPTVGLEEEHFVVDPTTRQPVPRGPQVVDAAAAQLGEGICCEFSRSQIELRTRPCVDASGLRDELLQKRSAAAAAAIAEGVRLCASGTPVIGSDHPIAVADHPRYRAGLDQYRAMLDDFDVCALHIHVHLPDPERVVLVGNHIRPWLPLLVALSANSPYHQGRATGYASWRAVIRGRFPCLGPPPRVESLRHFQELSTVIAQTGAMLDPSLPFWDIRPNPRFPTIEIRCADIVADVDDAVALAMLVRALVTWALAKVHSGDAGPRVDSEWLRAAYWRAARDGWSGGVVHPVSGAIVATGAVLDALVDELLADVLKRHGDDELIDTFRRRLIVRGTGADAQRAALSRCNELSGVVDNLIASTAGRT